MNMGRAKTIQGLTKRNVARVAWREAKTTEDAHKRLGIERRASERPWDGFVSFDLGFGKLAGPSIIATLQDLDEINRANDEKRFPKLYRTRRKIRVTGGRARSAMRPRIRSHAGAQG
jgi:hypothetical protein